MEHNWGLESLVHIGELFRKGTDAYGYQDLMKMNCRKNEVLQILRINTEKNILYPET